MSDNPSVFGRDAAPRRPVGAARRPYHARPRKESEPERVRGIDATASPEEVSREIWRAVEPLAGKLAHTPNPAVDNGAASATVSVPKRKLSF